MCGRLGYRLPRLNRSQLDCVRSGDICMKLSVTLTAVMYLDVCAKANGPTIGKRGVLELTAIKPNMPAPSGSFVAAGVFHFRDEKDNQRSVVYHYGSFTPVSLGAWASVQWLRFKFWFNSVLPKRQRGCY